MKKRIKQILSIILILLSLLYLLVVILLNKKLVTTRFDPQLFKKKYEQSQWMIPQSKNPISDEELYAYAGYRYINGENPIMINPELAPLGKYLVGLSIIFFQSHKAASLLASLISLVIIFLIIFKITKSFVAGSAGIFLTVINSLFIDQIIHAPQLDVFQLLFLLLFFLMFLLYLDKKKFILLILSGISFGCFISVKVFLYSFVVFNIFLLLFYLFKKNNWRKALFDLIIINTTGLITFVISYSQYFLHAGTARGFLGVQKWIFVFYRQSQINITRLLGNYLSLILFNRWRFWSTGYPIIHYDQWSVLWPIIFILGIFSAYCLYKKPVKKDVLIKQATLLFTSFFLVYNLFLFFIPIFPRYLLLLFVPLNILISLWIASKKI